MNRLLHWLREWVKGAPPGSRRESHVRIDVHQLEFDLRQMAGDKETLITRAVGWVELSICKDPAEWLRWHFNFAVKSNEKQWAESAEENQPFTSSRPTPAVP